MWSIFTTEIDLKMIYFCFESQAAADLFLCLQKPKSLTQKQKHLNFLNILILTLCQHFG